jgi:hypothetical protein
VGGRAGAPDGGLWPASDPDVMVDAIAAAAATGCWDDWRRIACPFLVIRAGGPDGREVYERMTAAKALARLVRLAASDRGVRGGVRPRAGTRGKFVTLPVRYLVPRGAALAGTTPPPGLAAFGASPMGSPIPSGAWGQTPRRHAWRTRDGSDAIPGPHSGALGASTTASCGNDEGGPWAHSSYISATNSESACAAPRTERIAPA